MATKEIIAIVGSVIGSIVVILGTVIALDMRLANRIDALDAKIERLNTLLTENLIAMKGEIGEVKGQMTSVQSHAHTHTTPNRWLVDGNRRWSPSYVPVLVHILDEGQGRVTHPARTAAR